MTRLFDLVDGSRDWLLGRALTSARTRRAIGDNETLEVIGREILAGFTDSLLSVCQTDEELSAFGLLDDGSGADPITLFAVHEAETRRTSLDSFICLLKCYRQAHVELLRDAEIEPDGKERYRDFVERSFDLTELAFCKQWAVAAERDVAAWRKAEQERDEQHNMLQTLLDATPDIVIFKDKDHAFRACSTVIAQMLGHTPAELVGKTDFDLWPADKSQLFWDEEAAMMKTGETLTSEHLLGTPWGERWYEAIKLPLYDADGRPMGLLSTERDISKRKEAEAALAAESQRLAVTLRSIGDGVITTDAAGNVTLLNRVAEELTGWTESEALGRPLNDVFHIINQKTRARCDNPVERVLQTGGIVGLANHTVLVSRDGLERSIADSGAPIHGLQGDMLGVVLVFRDVTEHEAIEEAVRREKDFAESLIETAQAIVLVLDIDGHVVRFNSYMEEVSGYRLAEVKGEDWFTTFLAEKDQASGRTIFDQAVAGRRTEGTISILRAMDGRELQVEWYWRALRDDEGQVVGTLSVGIDITERLRAEAERDEQRRMLQALLRTTPDLVLFKDRNSVFQAVSDTYCRLHGRKREEIVGHDDFAFFPPDDARRYREEEVRVMDGEVPVAAEHRLHTPWGERVFDVAKVPLRDEQGEVVGLLSAERDVTERKRTEQELAAEKERLDVTLRSIGDGVITTDTDGKIVLLNPVAEELTGWTQADARGKPLTEVFRILNEQTGEPCENPADRVLATGQVVSLANHTTLVARNGTRRIIADSGAPICDTGGHVLGVVLVFRDVTDRKLAEEAVRRERDFAESLVETAQAIVLVLDTDGRIVRFNSYMEEMSGYALSEVRGQDWFATFLPPSDHDRIKDEFLANINGTTSEGGVLPLVTRLGQQRDVEWFSRKLRDSDGNVAGVLSVGIDITARRRAEAERDEQQLMLMALLDITSDIIIFKDREQRFRACSTVIANILGRTQDELVGKTDYDLFPPDKSEVFWAEEQNVIQSGQTLVSEHLLEGADGTRWFEAVKKPLRDANGDVVGLLSTERDITDRKRAEAALQRAHEDLEQRVQERTADLAVANVKLQVEVAERKQAEAELQWQYQQADRARSETTAILDATGEAMALIAPDGWILSINRRFAEFFGLGPREVTGHRIDDLTMDFERLFADPAAIIPFISGSIADAEQRFTHVVSQKWPRQRELEVYSTPVRTVKGDHLGRLFVFRDVTREREVDRMKTEFVSLVSHELRTPLTSIKGYVDLMLGDKVGTLGDDQRKFLSIVKNNADRLVALINDLLDVSRIESGKIELKRTALDIRRLIQDTSNSLRPQLEAKAQRLTLSVADSLPTIAGDADRIALILTNLLSNAHKYTPPEGNIFVRASMEGERVRIDVQDSGIGMTPEEQSKLFTKFFRADNQMTAQAGGTGLGLVITRSLIEMHGGEISVTSTPGEGSTFSFTLPTTHKPIPRPAIVERGDFISIIGQPGRRILVVDDEPDIAGLIRLYLERAGYRVLMAHNAADALRVAKAEQPDLITLDLMLPDADGFTVLEWLKKEPLTRNIPVVLVSIMPDDGHGKLLGAVDYLIKPVPENILVHRIQEILADEESKVVLVADDDVDTRGLLAGHLLRAGFEVLEAGDGQEALEIIKKKNPGVVLLDIKMPIMDGISVLRTLRSARETRDLPVVMMTASPGLLEASRALTEVLGVSALLSKPFTAEELAAAIADGLGNRRQT